ncbi:50S ribosomal protein L4 [Koleobacter methoxysyntrophicus]|jgi:large subunit ribosomal protein L4|uniref:Large ribosomal subunit protein uL4 n=1 Tax=Koleobacter methoxysyntrophicus TaxID=2751313 RepID=A0A8A0RN03_9FIRM|nr:50S ribosomal protein L4 [Koleobacter methoxysyntrophicus]QSQ08968.1 50S ribosomal protein L4 [Koleobacter methoxysyntrophicus]
MPKVALYNVKGEEVGEVELKDSIFNVPVRSDILHQVVTMQLANKRQGTASTKTRAEVRGGGRKPWRQKGTGRARHGSIRSPIWTGGGIVFGPKPRSYNYTLPKKVKRLAMKCALSSKVADNDVLILDQLELEMPKTKEMVNILNNLKIDKKALIVTLDKDDNVEKSTRNIPGVKATMVGNLNVYDILKHDKLVLTKEALERVEEVYE